VLPALLSQMKISCLDAERKEARLRYQEHMQAYVQEQLGTPMEKLTVRMITPILNVT